jgi:putative membrane protein
MGQLTEQSKAELSKAVAEIEGASAAEIVIAVRPHSTPLLAPCALAGLVFGLAGLAFLMFSPWSFSHLAIWLDTLLLALFGALMCRRFSSVRRWCTPRALAVASVERAARAEFMERRVFETRDRSGILVYVAQTERLARVLPDRGVSERVDAAQWQAAVGRIEHSVHKSDDGVELAKAVMGLAPLLRAALPVRADDVNELEDMA